ncbi:zinc finger protein 398 [Tachyglossus aculeatus]|uniref:zinc finger protein 398 n=1 Tax=Tachyglossus aculeatus TaxID=9261 RepID=UPI0018F32D8D|nr:zinc finger protein 398 [Tachyglossus aculeatus]
MAQPAPVQASERDPEGSPTLPFCQPPASEAHLHTAAISLWTVVAAVQAVERKVEVHGRRLLGLEGRAGSAEKKLADCERTAAEFGSRLEGKWAVLETLLQEYGLLQRRLENMENLLRNRNFWVLRFPPATNGEVPKVPVIFDDVSVYFSAPEWEKLEDWQKELYKNIMKGNYESLVSMDYAMSQPDILSQPAPDETPNVAEAQPEAEEQAALSGPNAEPGISASDILSWIKQEEEPGGERLRGLVEEQGQEQEQEEAEDAAEEAAAQADQGPYGAGDGFAVKAEGPVPAQGPAVPAEENRAGPAGGSPVPAAPQAPRPGAGPREPGEAEAGTPRGKASGGRDGPPAQRPGPAGGERPYQCAHCGKGFVHPSRLTYHLRVHTGERPYACADCGKTFADRSRLSSHRRAHAAGAGAGGGPHACAQCGRSFGLKIGLLLHQRGHRQERRTFACAQCGLHFNCHSGLVRHRMIHTGERPYPCPDCAKSFVRKEHLLNHRRLHTGERPFHCAHCGKSFIRKHHLMKHQRIHTGERPYPCPRCDKGFRYKRALEDHLREHPPEPPDPHGLPPGPGPEAADGREGGGW